jgi:hypothetical protein
MRSPFSAYQFLFLLFILILVVIISPGKTGIVSSFGDAVAGLYPDG